MDWPAHAIARDVGREARDAALTRAKANAPFLERLSADYPDRVAEWLANGLDLSPSTRAALLTPPDLPPGAPGAAVMAALRRWRRERALLIALGDLAGELPPTAVTAVLTAIADVAVDWALARAVGERFPDAPPHGGIAVIALGKLGGGELNYSSDIDPVLLFDPDVVPRRPREEPVEAAVRIARRFIAILSDPAGGGPVLRVDLRLRPAPEASPIVLPVTAAIGYYESQALAWEQAAYIRARASGGDRALGRRFLAAIQPFVWRRSLDFRQLREIGRVTERIRDHHSEGQAFGPGFDVKRGRGGIREIEFYAQVHQLIFGGRDPALRAARTAPALAALAAAGHVAPDTATMLAGAYDRLRTVEHRLQMIEDRQTHQLPTGPAALDAVARLDGLADGAALLAELAPIVEAVGTAYDALIRQHGSGEAEGRALPQAPGALAARLGAAGYADGAAGARLIAGWRDGQARAIRSPAAREALELALPGLVAALGEGPDPDRALDAMDRVLGGMRGGAGFLNLIAARPDVLGALGAVLAHAPVLRDALAHNPALIEGLIDPQMGARGATVAELETALARGEDQTGGAEGYERLLDGVRRAVGERRFALGVDLVTARADALEVAAAYGRLAEASVRVLIEATAARFAEAHGRVPGGALIALALGRFGGGELTHASDLDVIFLFTGDHATQSDGARPLGASHYFNRLAQRVIAALSVPTAAGRLYDVDTRLRPWGAKGPLAVSVESFLHYQRDEAWAWEHMALARARVVAGPAAAGAALEAAIRAVLTGSRARATIRAEAAAMRAEMAAHKPPLGPLDVKAGPGGLIDLEFAVHASQIAHGTALTPGLPSAIKALAAAGLAPEGLGEAERLLTRMLVALRLVGSERGEPLARSRGLLAAAARMESWDELMAAHDEARALIADYWRQLRTDAP